jgi:biopolymer transport protein ExbD
MVINGDRGCHYDSIVQVIDIAKEIGVKRILLGTDAKKNG